MQQKRVPGVLGGMGPEATLDFMNRLMHASRAATDQDHLRVLIDHNPTVPNRHAAIDGTGAPVGPVLAQMAAGLERAGADFLVMVCNTAHAFQADIESACSIPFVSMIEVVIGQLRARHPEARRIGVMAADGCLEARLYQRALEVAGREAVVWNTDERHRFMADLYRIKAGNADQGTRTSLLQLGEILHQRGAELLVVGCTEIPLLVDAGDFPLPVLSSTDLLVERTIGLSLGSLVI